MATTVVDEGLEMESDQLDLTIGGLLDHESEDGNWDGGSFIRNLSGEDG